MESTNHTFYFVRSVMNRFAASGFEMWLAGGWAEELQGLCAPRQHHDIDLLYPATNFCKLDIWLASIKDLLPVYPKWFSHKRAVVCEQVLVEMLLLEPQSRRYLTRFFDSRYEFAWPDATLEDVSFADETVPVASCEALHKYRQNHYHIDAAYRVNLEAQLASRN